MAEPHHAFLREAGRILNSGQARSLLLTGNVHDLFFARHHEPGAYVPLLSFLIAQWNLAPFILVVYELNGSIQFPHPQDLEKVRDAWLRWRVGMDANQIDIQRMLAEKDASDRLGETREAFDQHLRKALNQPALALELMRQMCLSARTRFDGKRNLPEHLVLLVEGADLLIPEAPISHLSEPDRERVSICHDWFSDPGFVNGADSVVLIAESRSQLNQRIARLPQLLEVEVPAPDEATRRHFVDWFFQCENQGRPLPMWGSVEDLGRITAGLSLHALLQLLKAARHEARPLPQAEVIAKVEGFIKQQLGETTVEFKKPSHRLDDVVGFSRLREFLRGHVLPRLQLPGPAALPGATVCGPIGGGKTFIFEAVAAELDMVVLVLKNIRSKWFGETDVIFERLHRVLNALSRVLIFIDEADTQFGGLGADVHETERRLTGRIQSLMSDPRMRGRVFWLLVTARIHRLSPDLRRPGRVGDLIIPVLDPEGEDRRAFIQWMIRPVCRHDLSKPEAEEMDRITRQFSAAAFASIRSELESLALLENAPLTVPRIIEVIHDHLPPAIEETRRYQTLQALVNCTRRSLLPDPEVSDSQRQAWREEIARLEAKGME